MSLKYKDFPPFILVTLTINIVKYVSVISLFIPRTYKCSKKSFKIRFSTLLLDIPFRSPATILWVYNPVYCY